MFSLTFFWDRCQQLRLVAIETLFLSRLALQQVLSCVFHQTDGEVPRSIQRVLWASGNAFQSLFEVIVYQTESIVSTLLNIHLNTTVWINVAGDQHLKWLAACYQQPNAAMNLGFHPYTLLFTHQIVASQLAYQKLEPPSKCSIVKNQIFPIRHFLGELLSNTLKRIRTLSDNATKEKFVSYFEDSGEYISYNPYPKNSFSCNLSSHKTSRDSFAAHASQKISAFVTDKLATK